MNDAIDLARLIELGDDAFANECADMLRDQHREIKDLQARLEQAEKDSAMLEWMASRYLCADFRYGEPATEAIVIEIPRGSRVCGDLRVDISKAMNQ